MLFFQKAFSLIELLVIISILAALSALLMPSLKKTQEVALRVACKNTTSSTSQAWNLYVEDHNYKIFRYLDRKNRSIWTAYLKDYLQDPYLLICPSTVVPDTIPNNKYLMGSAKMAWVENRNYIKPIKDWNRSSYTYNINVGPGNPYNSASYEYLSDIANTSSTPLLGDGWWRAPARMYNSLTRYIPQNLDDPTKGLRGENSADRFITNRHGNMTVLTYVDGHSASVYLEEVFAQNWYKGYDRKKPAERF